MEFAVVGQCHICPLRERRNGQVISVRTFRDDPKQPRILFLGEAPGPVEVSIGQPFVGKSGDLLVSLLNRVGLLDHAIFTNAAVCAPTDRELLTDNDWKQIVSCCRPYVSNIIREYSVRAVVLLGEHASYFLTRKIALGRMDERNGILFIRTHHPARILREPRLETEFLSHMSLLKAKLGLTVSSPVIWKVLETPEEWVKSLRHWMTRPVVAMDMEVGLPKDVPSVVEVARNPDAVVICLGVGDGTNVDVLWFYDRYDELKNPEVVSAFNDILLNKETKKVFFRSSFEILWFYRLFSILPRPIEDPMLMAHAVDENLPSYSLQFLCNHFLHIGGWKEKVREELELLGTYDMGRIDKKTLTEYNAHDVAYTYRLYEKLSPLVDQEGVRGLLENCVYPTTYVLALAEGTGLPVSLKRVQELIDELKSEIIEFEKSVTRELSVPINPRSPRQWIEYLIKVAKIPEEDFPRTEKGNLSLTKAVLDSLIEKYPHLEILQKLRDYRLKQKLLSTYLEELPSVVVAGRVYPKFHQTGTVTGRLSCSSPPLQNFPSEKLELGKRLRKIFEAPEGWLFAEIDASQHELRVLANLSRDPNLMESFLSGGDVHRSNASKIFKKPPEEITEQERQIGKRLSFAVIYGASPQGISQWTGLPVEECERLLESMREAFPKAFEFLDNVARHASTHGYVRTVLGRKRRLPDAVRGRSEGARNRALRQAKNFVIQADASDWWCMVCVEWTRQTLKNGRQGRILLLVHDSCIILFPETELRDTLETFRYALDAVSKKLRLPVPIEGEYAIKRTLGDDPIEEGIISPRLGIVPATRDEKFDEIEEGEEDEPQDLA